MRSAVESLRDIRESWKILSRWIVERFFAREFPDECRENLIPVAIAARLY